MAIWTEVKLLFHVKRFSYDFCFYNSSRRKLTGLAGDAVVFSLLFLFMQTNKCQASYSRPLASDFSWETANRKQQTAVCSYAFAVSSSRDSNFSKAFIVLVPPCCFSSKSNSSLFSPKKHKEFIDSKSKI